MVKAKTPKAKSAKRPSHCNAGSPPVSGTAPGVSGPDLALSVLDSREKISCVAGKGGTGGENQGASSAPAATSKPQRRIPGRPFKPGQSGNPTGKSKEAAEIEHEVKRLALSACPKALRRLEYWRDSNNPKASVAACVELLNRGLGKPTQSLEIGGKDGAKQITFVVVHERADA
jgi:hypothetical protein